MSVKQLRVKFIYFGAGPNHELPAIIAGFRDLFGFGERDLIARAVSVPGNLWLYVLSYLPP